MQNTWILVADSARARIFEAIGVEPQLREIEDLVNPNGRAQNREIDTDARGRYFGTGEQGHTAPPNTDAVDHETERFSKSVSELLDKARNSRQYERLCIIAPPKFLGLMRQNLSKEALKLVQTELPKDLSWLDAKEIQAYLQERSKRGEAP